MLTDTHVHFDGLLAGGKTIHAIVERAAAGGVSRMLAIGGAPEANRMALEIARAFAGRIRAVVGYNRDQAKGGTGKEDDRRRTADDGPGQTNTEEDGMPNELENLLRAPEVAGIGEVGLDFHLGRDNALAQIELFRRMLLLARDHRLPVCVHTRAADAETLAALREHAAAWRGAPDRIGVMHCFTGGEAFARQLLALGFYISFSGIITFKNAGSLPAVAALTPDDRLLIETDSPYLAPAPFRGQPNEPAHVRRVAETLAAIRHTSLEKIAEITAGNAAKLFEFVPARR